MGGDSRRHRRDLALHAFSIRLHIRFVLENVPTQLRYSCQTQLLNPKHVPVRSYRKLCYQFWNQLITPTTEYKVLILLSSRRPPRWF